MKEQLGTRNEYGVRDLPRIMQLQNERSRAGISFGGIQFNGLEHFEGITN